MLLMVRVHYGMAHTAHTAAAAAAAAEPKEETETEPEYS